MPSFVKKRAIPTIEVENLILPHGKIVAEQSPDEGMDPLQMARGLARDNFTGYVLLRDIARTRRGLIMLMRGREVGILLQVGRENLSGKEAVDRLMADYPAISLAVTAHALEEKIALAASSIFIGSHFYHRLPTTALVLSVVIEYWQAQKLSGMIWAGNRSEGVAAFFFKGVILGEIESGGSKLQSRVSRLSAMWSWSDMYSEAYAIEE